MSDNYLKISKDALTSAQKTYEDKAEEMRTLKTDLKGKVDAMRSGWDSEAGKAFLKKFDDEWLVNIEDYSDVIAHMGKNMSIANNKYAAVYEEAEKLKIK